MKTYQVVARPNKPPRSLYYVKRKHLTNPVPDVICVVVLAAVLAVVGYMQVRGVL